MPKKFIERFERIDYLIARKATGNPSAFAKKMDISESTLYEYLSELKEKGAPIQYNKYKKTYFYSEEGRFKIFFEKTSTPFKSE